MWAKQQITACDVDYSIWNKQKEAIRKLSDTIPGCVFTVDVYKERYDFASGSFSRLFGFNPRWLENIGNQGDLLEERIHPDDRKQLIEQQINHSHYIYSLPPDERNDYQQAFEFRMHNTRGNYINVISRQKVIQKDRNGKAWIIMGIIDVSPDQCITGKIKCSVTNLKTGEILIAGNPLLPDIKLTRRELEIIRLISGGFLSKEIAYKLNISIHTVNNHRKNIYAKLNVNNAVEAVNYVNAAGLLNSSPGSSYSYK